MWMSDILVCIWKLSKYMLAPPLSNVINERIVDDIFPDNLKITSVVPISKLGDSRIPSNNRLISALRYLLKTFEKMLYIRLNDYFIRKNLLCQHQHIFWTLCHLLRSKKTIWFGKSLHIADKTWALWCKRKHLQCMSQNGPKTTSLRHHSQKIWNP